MINYAEIDLRLATHQSETAHSNRTTWQQPLAHRASAPGSLTARLRGLTLRFAPHGRRTAAQAATNGPAHS